MKGEIDEAIVQLVPKLEVLLRKVKSNVKSAENPDGLLTRGLDQYFGCLDFNSRKLERLLQQDEAHWAEQYD